MAATRRLQKELQDIRKSGLKSFRDIVVDEQNILQWQGLLVPDTAPYAKGAFKIDIQASFKLLSRTVPELQSQLSHV